MFASAPAKSTLLPRKCFRLCDSNLAGTWKRERGREAPRKRSPHSLVGAAPVGRSTHGPSQTTARSRRIIKEVHGTLSWLKQRKRLLHLRPRSASRAILA